MYKAQFTLVGVTPVIFSRPLREEKGAQESHAAFDARIWRTKAHTNREGEILLTAPSIKSMLMATAQRLAEKVPGRRGATFTKIFTTGIIVDSDAILTKEGKSINQADLVCEEIYCHADGKRGSGVRVMRSFPLIEAGWRARVEVVVTDAECITPDVLERHLRGAGLYNGVGSFAVRAGHGNGRFKVEDFSTTPLEL